MCVWWLVVGCLAPSFPLFVTFSFQSACSAIRSFQSDMQAPSGMRLGHPHSTQSDHTTYRELSLRATFNTLHYACVRPPVAVTAVHPHCEPSAPR